jgi:hypothetical protein
MRIILAVALTSAIAGCGGGTGDAGSEASAVTDAPQPSLVAYFLKFPSDEAARASIPDLEALGFTPNAAYTEAFGEEGDKGWLVVERSDSEEDIPDAEAELSEVAERHGGIYDGWEAAAS